MLNPTQRWVASLKAEYAYLPNTLTLKVEIDALDRLESWFERVKQYRLEYDETPRSDLPEWLQSESGKRQIIPVLWALEETTDEENLAINELFVCLSAFIAEQVTYYYQRQAQSGHALDLEDVLQWTPLIFRYVLSSFNPYRKTKKHENNFSHSTDGRIRLITYLRNDIRRHISTYVLQHSYYIKYPGTVHRNRSKLRRAASEFERTHHGAMPSTDALADSLSKRTSQTLDEKLKHQVTTILQIETPRSWDATIDVGFRTSEGRQQTLGETIEDVSFDTADVYQPGEAIRSEFSSRGSAMLMNAIRKLLDPHTTSKLSIPERVALGS